MKKKEYQFGEYGALVGNKEPGVIKKHGLMPVTHVASEAEYWFQLKANLAKGSRKLFEESDSVSDLTEKLAEIRETLAAIAEFAGIDERQIENARELIETRDGSFSKRIILDRIDTQ